MLKNKVKELLKNKKIIAVGAFVVVALGLAGATLALSSNATPINEVSKANEVSNKQDSSKDNKVNSNKDNKGDKNKDSKKEETSNSPSEDKEVDTHEHDEDGNHVHEEDRTDTLVAANTGSAEETNVNSGTSSNTSNTASSSSSSPSTNTGSSSSSNTNTGSSNSTVAPSEPSHDHDHTHDHVHKWVPITQQITHPEEGYWADELVSDAWTEEIPVYEKQAREICNGCGLDVTEDPRAHSKEQMLAGNYACGGYHTEYKQVQVGTNTVYHDAIYSKKWIVSSPAWVETVTTGYQCSDCGAIQ